MAGAPDAYTGSLLKGVRHFAFTPVSYSHGMAVADSASLFT
jgi:hypothetical protein